MPQENPPEFIDLKEKPTLAPRAQQALRWALEFAERFTDKATDDIQLEWGRKPYPHGTLRAALAYLLTGTPENTARAKALLARNEVTDSPVNIPIIVIMLKTMAPILDDETRQLLLDAIARTDTKEAEDIIAGRNINIPMMAWTTRIAQGVLFDKPDLLQAGIAALERLTDLVAAHGTIPEYNCPTYHPVTLLSLRAIGLLGEPTTSRLAGALERHLWEEMAWRYHPQLRSVCGPWARAYHSELIGGSGLVQLLLHIAWDALFEPEADYDYYIAHCHLHGGIFPLYLQSMPSFPEDIALNKQFPLTVISAAENAPRKLGLDEYLTWVPGGISELTTWMNDHLALSTASRCHLHGLQNASYLAQWSRTGRRVASLEDFGQAFMRFTTNGKRPGDEEFEYHHHQAGGTFRIYSCLWGDDGRPFILQSGPTALVLYLLKGQERWNVKTIEMMTVVPRLDTIDAVLVDGQPAEYHEGAPGSSVIIQSGEVALGLRFEACDESLVTPRLFIERKRNHLFVGLRLVAFSEERELPAETYRRYAGAIGTEIRHCPNQELLAAFQRDIQEAQLSDCWEMAVEGGPREASFHIGQTSLSGRFDPIGETWLRRLAPPHPGRTIRISLSESEDK